VYTGIFVTNHFKYTKLHILFVVFCGDDNILLKLTSLPAGLREAGAALSVLRGGGAFFGFPPAWHVVGPTDQCENLAG